MGVETMRIWAGIGVGLLLAVNAGAALAAKPSQAQVNQLFEVMHLSQMFTRMNSQMAGLMGRATPCVPATYWQGFIDADGTRQLMKQMVPVYQRHFTAADIAGLLKFYKSPLGQKMIAQMPLTMAEGMKIGQQWGRQRGEEMVRELQQKGVLDANGRCPAAAAATPAPLPGKATKGK